MDTAIPDIVIIGHICLDKTDQGYTLGGAAAYSGLFAQKLGKQVGIVTSIKDDFPFIDWFTGIEIHKVPTKKNTVFKNSYQNNRREQSLLGRASDLSTKNIPESWKNAPLVFIGPIANEVDPGILDQFEKAMICVNPQGWMRRWDDKGKVYHSFSRDWNFLTKADMVCLSLEDLDGDQGRLDQLKALCRLLIITEGKKGASVYSKKSRLHFPAFPANEIDPTGAGDIFAIAFLIKYSETKDLETAMKFAHMAAAISIENPGTEGIPGRKMINDRLKPYLSE